MKNPLSWLLMQYVKRSKRFEGILYVEYHDEAGIGYQCPVCQNVATEPWKICEKCFYPLPLIGGSKPKD